MNDKEVLRRLTQGTTDLEVVCQALRSRGPGRLADELEYAFWLGSYSLLVELAKCGGAVDVVTLHERVQRRLSHATAVLQLSDAESLVPASKC